MSVAAAAKALGNKRRERRERRKLATPLGERPARQLRERLLQDYGRPCVRGAKAMFVVEGEHTRREIPENAFKVSARGLRRAPRLLRFLLRFGELRGHRVERFGEDAKLVARGHRLATREIALRDRARAFGE